MGLTDLLKVAKQQALGVVSGIEQDIANGKGIAGTATSAVHRVRKTNEALRTLGVYRGIGNKVKSTFTGAYARAESFLETTTEQLGHSLETPESRKELGEKFVTFVRDNYAKGRDSVIAAYRAQVPSQEEVSARYGGIGSDYKGVLLRPNYEGVLEFESIAMQRLNGAEGRAIATDIRASASESKPELLTYLSTKEASARTEAVRQVYKDRQAIVVRNL